MIPRPKNWPYTKGPCAKCGRKVNLRTMKACFYKGLCTACRQPTDRRKVVAAGVPPGSADALALIMRKCIALKKSDRATEALLAFVHPRLMENIAVRGGILTVKAAKYIWDNYEWRKV